MDWQPIETAPEGQTVLVFEGGEQATAKLEGGRWILSNMGAYIWDEGYKCFTEVWSAPTHWMPLPDPPRAHAPTPPDTPEKGA